MKKNIYIFFFVNLYVHKNMKIFELYKINNNLLHYHSKLLYLL